MHTFPKKLFEELRRANDRLGRYSDHEGQEDGSTYFFWIKGPEKFALQCVRAIEDHEAAIRIWRRLHRENSLRAKKAPEGRDAK